MLTVLLVQSHSALSFNYGPLFALEKFEDDTYTPSDNFQVDENNAIWKVFDPNDPENYDKRLLELHLDSETQTGLCYIDHRVNSYGLSKMVRFGENSVIAFYQNQIARVAPALPCNSETVDNNKVLETMEGMDFANIMLNVNNLEVYAINMNDYNKDFEGSQLDFEFANNYLNKHHFFIESLNALPVTTSVEVVDLIEIILKPLYQMLVINNPNFGNEDSLTVQEKKFFNGDAFDMGYKDFLKYVWMTSGKVEMIMKKWLSHCFLKIRKLFIRDQIPGGMQLLLSKTLYLYPSVAVNKSVLTYLISTLNDLNPVPDEEQLDMFDNDSKLTDQLMTIIDQTKEYLKNDPILQSQVNIESITAEELSQRFNPSSLRNDLTLKILAKMDSFKMMFISNAFNILVGNYSVKKFSTTNLGDQKQFKYFIKVSVVNGDIVSEAERDKEFINKIAMPLLQQRRDRLML